VNDQTNHSRDREIQQRLVAERPVPRAGYRAELRAHLLASRGTADAPPQRLRLLIAAYAGSGAVLLIVAAIGVAGAGPLAS
jgi:hypothetical protein